MDSLRGFVFFVCLFIFGLFVSFFLFLFFFFGGGGGEAVCFLFALFCFGVVVFFVGVFFCTSSVQFTL